MIYLENYGSREAPAARNEAARSSKPVQARRPALRSALGMALLLGIPLAAQSPQFPTSRNTDVKGQFPDTNGLYDQNPNSPDQKRMQALNAQRQKSIVSDTEKLLQLAKQLNDEVAAGDADQMSEQQMRKVAEIGKLARSVKDKMCNSLGGYPTLNTPLTIPTGVE